MIKKIKRNIVLLLILNIFFYFKLTSQVEAQNAISLSVTPPILEAMVMPGKEIKQVYSLTNSGGDTIITPKIYYFETSDDNGNVSLTDTEAPEWVKYDKSPFNLKFQDEKQFTVLISPPEDAEEIDYFLTLVFESTAPTDILGQNAIFYKTQIGTNILLTISKDGSPQKGAQIVEFQAPKIIDSVLGEISYKVIVRNIANSYWKPNGKIILEGNKSLKLAPLNVVSGGTRQIRCIENEAIVDCKVKGNLKIGQNKSTIEFSIDDDPKVYKETVNTFVFPFIYLFVAIALLTIAKVQGIFNIWRKRK